MNFLAHDKFGATAIKFEEQSEKRQFIKLLEHWTFIFLPNETL